MKDKKKYYHGFVTDSGKKKDGTKIFELLFLTDNMDEFSESDIVVRFRRMKETFIEYLRETDLLIV